MTVQTVHYFKNLLCRHGTVESFVSWPPAAVPCGKQTANPRQPATPGCYRSGSRLLFRGNEFSRSAAARAQSGRFAEKDHHFGRGRLKRKKRATACHSVLQWPLAAVQSTACRVGAAHSRGVLSARNGKRPGSHRRVEKRGVAVLHRNAKHCQS